MSNYYHEGTNGRRVTEIAESVHELALAVQELLRAAEVGKP